MKKTILIAEDEELQLSYIKRDILTYRSNKYTIVGEARNGIELLNLWKKLKPDILIVDLNMPQITGGEAIYEIRKKDKKTKIIVLTSLEDESLINAFLKYSDAYLLKTHETPKNFLKKLDEVAFTDKKEVRDYLLPKIRKSKEEKINLSLRQLEITYGIKHGLKNNEIAKKLFITKRAVEKAVQNLLVKFNVKDRHELAAKFDEKKVYGKIIDDKGDE